MDRKRQRLTYLLRLWQTDENGTIMWHASLESVSGPVRCLASAGMGSSPPGGRERFTGLAELVAFLEQETTWPIGRMSRPSSLDDEDA